MLTSWELDPYHFYDRAKKEFNIKIYGRTPEELAVVTAKMYFKE